MSANWFRFKSRSVAISSFAISNYGHVLISLQIIVACIQLTLIGIFLISQCGVTQLNRLLLLESATSPLLESKQYFGTRHAVYLIQICHQAVTKLGCGAQ